VRSLVAEKLARPRGAALRGKALRGRARLQRREREVLDEAVGLIPSSAGDPAFWKIFISQPGVEEFLRRSLAAKASRDASFARSVVTASGGCPEPVDGCSGGLPKWLDGPSKLSSIEKLPAPTLPSTSSCSSCGDNVLRRPWCQYPPCSTCNSEAPAAPVTPFWTATSQDSPLRCDSHHGTLVSSSCREHGAALRCREALVGMREALLGVAEPLLLTPPQLQSSPGTRGFGCEERHQVRKRRRLLSKSHPEITSKAQEVCQQRQPVLGSLGAELTAFTMSYIDLPTKVLGVRRASDALRHALECRAAWDPLHLDQAIGRAFFRLLKRQDPLGCFTADVSRTKRMLPGGFFEVQNLEAVLMNPERVELEQSDTEDDTFRPRPLVIADPLDEVCKRLRHYFTSVRGLVISNIEDFRMDYRFVGLRAGSLADFGFVELVHTPSSWATSTYTLRACKDAPPSVVDPEAAKRENRSRLPPGVHFDEATMFSEREALYLAEHRSAYKNGDDFFLIHALHRTVRSHGVRKRYKSVVAALRQRFPERFKSGFDTGRGTDPGVS